MRRYALAMILAMVVSTLSGTRSWADLLVGSIGSGNIYKLDPTTGTSTVFVPSGSGGLTTPFGMQYGPSGRLDVVDLAGQAVRQYNATSGAPAGNLVTLSSGLPFDLQFVPGNLLWVGSNSNQIIQYNATTGSPTGVMSAITSPTGMTLGPDGNLYVSSLGGNLVEKFNPTTGADLGAFIPAGRGGLSGTNDILFLSDGSVLVSSSGGAGSTDSVLHFDSAGNFLNIFASNLNDPLGLLQQGSNVFVANSGANQVLEYNLSGGLINTFTGITTPSFLLAPVPEPTSLVLLGLGARAWPRSRFAVRRGPEEPPKGASPILGFAGPRGYFI